MTEAEMLARIAELETALRLVVAMWIVSIVLMASLVPTVPSDSNGRPRCPLCFKHHFPGEGCR